MARPQAIGLSNPYTGNAALLILINDDDPRQCPGPSGRSPSSAAPRHRSELGAGGRQKRQMRAGPAHSSNSSSATSKSSTSRHRSGSKSGHEMTPTFSFPFSDIAVTLSPQPWNSGPSGYIASTP